MALTKAQDSNTNEPDVSPDVPDAANGILDSGSYTMNKPVYQPGPDYAWLNKKKQLLRDMDRVKKEHRERMKDAQLL